RRLVFLGTPEMAVPPLRALIENGFDVALVVTRPDKRRGRGGRGGELSPSPVKAAALELGVPVSHNVDDALGAGADLGVVVAFGAVETVGSLGRQVVEGGTGLLSETLRDCLADTQPQQGEPTYAAKIEPDGLRLDWSRPATELDRVVRVGGAWTTFRGRRLK